MRAGNWEAVMPLPPKLLSVNSFDLKSMSFKFSNDIFITFEMPRVAYVRAQEIKFLLIRGP